MASLPRLERCCSAAHKLESVLPAGIIRFCRLLRLGLHHGSAFLRWLHGLKPCAPFADKVCAAAERQPPEAFADTGISATESGKIEPVRATPQTAAPAFPLITTLAASHKTNEEEEMDLVIWKIRFALRTLVEREEGQDLVEYAMIVALMALGAVAGANSVGTAIDRIFGQLAAILYIAL